MVVILTPLEKRGRTLYYQDLCMPVCSLVAVTNEVKRRPKGYRKTPVSYETQISSRVWNLPSNAKAAENQSNALFWQSNLKKLYTSKNKRPPSSPTCNVINCSATVSIFIGLSSFTLVLHMYIVHRCCLEGWMPLLHWVSYNLSNCEWINVHIGGLQQKCGKSCCCVCVLLYLWIHMHANNSN